MLTAAIRYGIALSVLNATEHRSLPTPFPGIPNRSFRAIIRSLSESRRATYKVPSVKMPHATVFVHINQGDPCKWTKEEGFSAF